MNKEFVPYDLAIQLKELGFNENCFRGYMRQYDEWIISDMIHDNHCPLMAPLYQQAFRFFREKYNLIMHIQRHSNKKYLACMGIQVEILCDTYEEAELACLKKLIEIVKNK